LIGSPCYPRNGGESYGGGGEEKRGGKKGKGGGGKALPYLPLCAGLEKKEILEGREKKRGERDQRDSEVSSLRREEKSTQPRGGGRGGLSFLLPTIS